jgi:hypothetical protein
MTYSSNYLAGLCFSLSCKSNLIDCFDMVSVFFFLCNLCHYSVPVL